MSDYAATESDAREWLRVGKGLMLSARVIWAELYPLLGPKAFDDAYIEPLMALWRS